MAADGLTDEEVARGRGQLKGGMVLWLEDTGSRMSRLGKSELSYGEYLPVREVLARLDAVDEDQVRAVAAELFGQETCLAVVGPVRASPTSTGSEPPRPCVPPCRSTGRSPAGAFAVAVLVSLAVLFAPADDVPVRTRRRSTRSSTRRCSPRSH